MAKFVENVAIFTVESTCEMYSWRDVIAQLHLIEFFRSYDGQAYYTKDCQVDLIAH